MHVIQIDSREKKNDHVLDAINMYGNIRTLNSKLPFGDYCNISKDALRVIERKNSINELCTCLGQEMVRFSAELRNGTKLGFYFIILVEAEGYTCIEDLKKWVNPFAGGNPRAMTGTKMFKILEKFLKFYNMEVVFTTKDDAGFEIVRLLGADV